jgi:hypothetical protein
MKKLLGLSGFTLLTGFVGYLVLLWTHTGFVSRIYEDAENVEWKYTLFVPTELVSPFVAQHGAPTHSIT